MADDKKDKKDNRTEQSKALERLIESQEGGNKLQENKSEYLIKLQDENNALQRLRDLGQVDRADKLQKAIDESAAIFEKSNNNAAVANRLEELSKISAQTKNLLAKQENVIKTDSTVSSLNVISKTLKEQTSDIVVQTKTDTTVKNSINKLLKVTEAGDPVVIKLQEDFLASQKALKVAMESGDRAAIDLAKAQIESVEGAATSEEDRREAIKKQEASNSILLKMSDKLSGLGGKVTKTGGFLAGIAGLATLFFSPETFAKIVRTAINIFQSLAEMLTNLVNGDFTALKENFKENAGLISAIIGGSLLLILPKVLTAVNKLHTAFKTFSVFMKSQFVANMITNLKDMMASVGGKLKQGFDFLVGKFKLFRTTMMTSFIPSMWSSLKSMMSSLGGKLMKGLIFVTNVAKAFRGVMLVTVIPGIIAALTAMGTSLMAFLAPFAVPIAIAAAIGLVVVGIGVALTKLRDALGFTSVFDVIMLGAAHLQDAFGHIVNLMGSYVNFILGMVEKFGKFLGFEIDLPEIPKMSTDNAAKKRVELEEKAKAEKEEKAKAALENKEDPNSDQSFLPAENKTNQLPIKDVDGFEKEIFIDEKSDEANQLSTKELDDVRFKAATSEDDEALMLAKMDSTDGANRFDTKEGRAELRKTLGAETKDDLLKFKEAGETEYASDNQRVNSMVADKLLEFQKDFQKPPVRLKEEQLKTQRDKLTTEGSGTRLLETSTENTLSKSAAGVTKNNVVTQVQQSANNSTNSSITVVPSRRSRVDANVAFSR